jgi:hypothetical protein
MPSSFHFSTAQTWSDKNNTSLVEQGFYYIPGAGAHIRGVCGGGDTPPHVF